MWAEPYLHHVDIPGRAWCGNRYSASRQESNFFDFEHEVGQVKD